MASLPRARECDKERVCHALSQSPFPPPNPAAMNHWQGLTEQAADFGILEGYYLNSQHSTQMSFDNSMDDIGT